MPPNRLPYFRFDVQSYLTDPAVLHMDADSEGCYIRLLARMWQSPTPGVVAASLIHELAGLSRLSEQYRVIYRQDAWEPPEGYGGPVSCEEIGVRRSVEVMDQLSAAFEVGEASWTQRRMVAEWRLVCDASKACARAGLMSAQKRKISTTVERPLNDRATMLEVDVQESTQDSKEERRTSGPSARCLARCQIRFPKLDLPIIEAKLMAYHGTNPFKRLDIAMLNWCKKAEKNGWDQLTETLTEVSEWDIPSPPARSRGEV